MLGQNRINLAPVFRLGVSANARSKLRVLKFYIFLKRSIDIVDLFDRIIFDLQSRRLFASRRVA